MSSESNMSNCVPVDQFYYAVGQMQDRLNILIALNSFVSELSEIDNAYSRALTKIGSILPSTNSAKLENFQQVNGALDNVSRILTQRAPHISNNSQSVQQNLAKLFPDYAKNNLKKIKASTSRISNSLEEIKKLKFAYHKSLDHYYKSSKDIENLIRQKDSWSSGEVSPSTDEKDDKSVRTLSSILSKTYSGKEDPKEKCRSMLAVFDAEEQQLATSYKRVKNSQNDLRADLVRALDEIYDIESTRQQNVKDGANNCMISAKLMVDRLSELINLVATNIQTIELSSDLVDLCRVIDLSFGISQGGNNGNNSNLAASAVCIANSEESRSRSSSDGSISSVQSTSSIPDHLSLLSQPAVPSTQDIVALAQSTPESLHKVIEMIGRSDKMSEGLNNFSKICGKIFTFYSEILQSEKS